MPGTSRAFLFAEAARPLRSTRRDTIDGSALGTLALQDRVLLHQHRESRRRLQLFVATPAPARGGLFSKLKPSGRSASARPDSR
ncbi:hypothetical protein Ddc_20344 [Ditylenchus destructor]|nr:hypothetical protein Ddc_20344 [Ditylenchus destructor]